MEVIQCIHGSPTGTLNPNETMTTQNGDIKTNRFPRTGKGAVLCVIGAKVNPIETGATGQTSPVKVSVPKQW